MAITYNNLDNYLNNHEPIDSALLSQIETSSTFHKWNKDNFKVFKDSANGYFHIPKDTIIKTEKKVGLTTIATGCRASEDAILKSTSAPLSRSTITALYTANANIKFYSSTPDDYLVYKNFDNTFDFKKIYSVATYPWIKIGTNSYRDRMGDWDLNGNVEINTQQALCSSLKEAYKINGAPIWPETYQKYTPANNTWTPIEPELTTSPNVEKIDSNDNRINPQTVWKWPQRDYLFDNKYITSCDIGPVIGTANSPYQFSDEYLTKFAQTKPADPESRKVEKMGFTSVKWLGKILQQPIEDFNKGSIKSLTVSWTDDTKTECNITANYDTKPVETRLWTKIPKDRSLGIMIRLPGDIWRQYNEERLIRPRSRSPIQLPWFVYNETTQNIESKHGTPAYDWTWLNNRDNRPWYYKNGLGDFRIQLPFQAGRKPIPQLKILFSNKYYYVSTKLEKLFEGRGNVKSITIFLYTGQFKSTMWGDRISFNCSDGGKIEFDIETTAKEAGQQWGWNIKTLSHSGSMDNWDRELVYLVNGQSEFNDLYNIVGGSDSNSLFSQLKVLNNIDLFTDNYGIETITGAKDFSELFNAPRHQINGWITTCDPAGSNNGYITLDWSYNLVLKNRLLPYADQMFLPITDWKEHHRFSGHDEVANETFSRFANNQDTSITKEPFFGYNVGVRVFNASQNDCDRDNPMWEQGPWVGKTISIKYDGDMWNSLKNSNSLYGAYRKRYSMAYQFKHYSDTQLDKWFNWSDNPDHFIAPPVGLVLE